MKKLFIATCILTLIGCNSADKENEVSENKANQLTVSAALSKEKISELPLGFQFGMNQADVNERLSALIQENKLSAKGQYYYYRFPAINGDTIESGIRFRMYENELYSVQLSISTFGVNNDTIVKLLTDNLNYGLDSLYKKASYYDKIESEHGDTKFTFSYWVKENQVIFLRNNGSIDLFYKNAPIDKIVTDLYVDNAIKEARDRADEDKVDVKNSSWDGSVSQVKKHLKQNLIDPGSYESIEWGG